MLSWVTSVCVSGYIAGTDCESVAQENVMDSFQDNTFKVRDFGKWTINKRLWSCSYLLQYTKCLAVLSIRAGKAVDKARRHHGGAGNEFLISRADSCLVCRAPGNFPYPSSAFYHKYSHVQPYQRVYFATGVCCTKDVQCVCRDTFTFKHSLEVYNYFYLLKFGVHLYWQSRKQHLKSRKRQPDSQQAVRTQNGEGSWRCCG